MPADPRYTETDKKFCTKEFLMEKDERDVIKSMHDTSFSRYSHVKKDLVALSKTLALHRANLLESQLRCSDTILSCATFQMNAPTTKMP